MQFEIPFSADAVFERTVSGQRAVLTHGSALTTIEWRLLAVLNGFTPLHDLQSLMGEEIVSKEHIVSLLEQGLIRIVDLPKPGSKRIQPVHGLDHSPSYFIH